MKQKFLLFVLCLPVFIFAQQIHEPLTKTEQQQVVDSVSKLLENSYVFPETGKSMGDYIKQKKKEGKYDAISDPVAFADSLSKEDRKSVV